MQLECYLRWKVISQTVAQSMTDLASDTRAGPTFVQLDCRTVGAFYHASPIEAANLVPSVTIEAGMKRALQYLCASGPLKAQKIAQLGSTIHYEQWAHHTFSLGRREV